MQVTAAISAVLVVGVAVLVAVMLRHVRPTGDNARAQLEGGVR